MMLHCIIWRNLMVQKISQRRNRALVLQSATCMLEGIKRINGYMEEFRIESGRAVLQNHIVFTWRAGIERTWEYFELPIVQIARGGVWKALVMMCLTKRKDVLYIIKRFMRRLLGYWESRIVCRPLLWMKSRKGVEKHEGCPPFCDRN